MTLLVEAVSKQYSNHVLALNQLSFHVVAGESVGIVGESGSGKSTLAKLLVGIESYNKGTITFDGTPIVPKKRIDQTKYRKNVQMVFQDAVSALNPNLPIWKSLMEPLDNYKEFTPSFLEGENFTRKEIAEQLLEMVGLEKEMANRLPGELSGGQKQRVSIARAISMEPKLLICDEPTASLDASIQVQILDLLKELQRKSNMMILFISHDIRAVAYLCERLMVLKDGIKVDEFQLEDIYHEDRHDYTKALIQAAAIN